MTCSDSDDSLDASNEGCSTSQTINTTEQRPQTTERKVVASTNNSAIPPKEPTIANVLSILTTVSEHIKDMQTKTEAIQKEVASISNRLTRVEKKVGISLATVEQMKDVIVTSDALTFDKGPDNPATNRFELKAVSNETEFTELDTKLGADEEYYAKVKRWLVMHINSDEPEKRMVLAMDLVFEPDSEDELEDEARVTTNTSFYTSLTMTCSDSEDSHEASAGGSSMPRTISTNSQPETAEMSNDLTLWNESSSREPTIAKVQNILTIITKRVKKMHRATDFIQKEVGTISNRLTHIEKRMDASMETLQTMKNVIIKAYEVSANQESDGVELLNFEFKKVSNEEEFTELDTKLGNDGEYYAKVKKWLKTQIHEANPDNRMHIALDLIFERAFLPQCSGSEDEQEYEIFATADEAFFANLRMTCSDTEDPFEGSAAEGSVSKASHSKDHPRANTMPSSAKLQNGFAMKDSTANALLSMFRSLSKQMTEMHTKIDRLQKEVSNNTERLDRVEKKMGISLTKLEQVKDIVKMTTGNQGSQEMLGKRSPTPTFEFEKITNEKELTEFNTKLGQDETYYSDMIRVLRRIINADDPANRMHEAMDMFFDRAFMPLCSWTGYGLATAKIAFGTRANILKLFADIGTTNCVSEIEQEQDMLATTVDPLLTNVKMSCSDSEDPFADCTVAADSVSHISHANKPTPTPTIVTSSVLALQNEGTSNEFTPSRVVNMFRLVLESVKRVQASTDSMRQELSNIFQRLERVEKKVGISLATLETVKDGMVMNTDVPETQSDDPSEPRFVFKKISNEEEFTEFDFKLASDEEYYSNVKKWLNQQIGVDDPNNRMLVAMDLLMERKFFAQCTWTAESENEQEVAISTTASDALLTGLKMTCSDSEDSFDASAGAISPIWSVLSLLEVPNVSSAKESPATVMDMFSSVLEHVNEVQKTAELTRKEMERISDRLGRVEKKVGIFLAALDDVKDGIAMKEKISAYEASILSVCTKRISNEEEFTEFDSKLGSDEEYYSNVKNWLKMQIYEINPKSRMSKALDLLMERAFFTQCSWNGTSTMQESKNGFESEI
uniref:DUF4806 domain-containing protein n=1 Tax=Anopheles culicifacies TaxID=139723 RepID=A0A182MV86_9DIPT